MGFIIFRFGLAIALLCLFGDAVVRREHGVDQQPVVGRPPAPPLALAVIPETPELCPSVESRLVALPGRVSLVFHQPQGGRLSQYGLYLDLFAYRREFP